MIEEQRAEQLTSHYQGNESGCSKFSRQRRTGKHNQCAKRTTNPIPPGRFADGCGGWKRWPNE